MNPATDDEWVYVSYDKNGTWTIRTKIENIMDCEINLVADWPNGIPLVAGQQIGTWVIPETRHYSVQEITDAIQ